MKRTKSPQSRTHNTRKSTTERATLSKNASLIKKAHHHTRRVIRMTPMFVHGAVAGTFIGIVAVLCLRAAVPASAITLSEKRDCDTNAVINCGALTTTELQQRYANKGVAAIYSYFGITSQDIAATGTTAVAGRVGKDGSVTVDGKVVATAATTAGRENISGSTKVTSGGVTFYKRPPKVSFRVDSIVAFVILQDGQFKFAILGACGNPVIATAVPRATTPTPAPVQQPVETPTTPDVSPPATETITPVSSQTPESKPTVVLAAQPTSQPLPNTGPGAVAIVGLLAVLGGYLFHATHRHIRHKRRLHHSA